MSALGSLVVKLALEYAEYTKGLNKSDQEALKFAQNAQRHFDMAAGATKEFFVGVAQGAVGAVSAYLSVSTALSTMKRSIDEMDKLDELSEKLMVDTTTLQEFAYAGKLTGVELEGLATGLKKLQVNMVESITGGQEQAAVFKALGVSVKDADGNLRSSNDVMLDVADVFASLEDAALKTALATKLFGKQGAEMIPFLTQGKEGIKKLTDEAHSLGGVLSSEQLKTAAEFNDNLDRMATLSGAAAKQFTAGFIPAINDVIKRLIEAQKESKGFLESLSTAAAMTFDKASGLSYGKQIQNLQGQIEKGELARENRDKLPSLLQGFIPSDEEMAEARRRLRTIKNYQANLALEDSASDGDSKDGRVAIFNASASGKPSSSAIAAALADGKDGAGNALSAYDKLIKSINEKIALDQRQIELGRPLTESEKTLAKIMADRATGTLKLTDAEFGAVKAQIQKQSILERILGSREEAERIEKERLDAAQKEIEAAFKSVEAMQRELDLLGKLPSQITAVNLAKLEARKASLALSGEALPQELAAVEALIIANQRLQSLQETREGIDAAIEASKLGSETVKSDWTKSFEDLTRAVEGWGRGFTDSIVNMAMTGKLQFKSLANSAIADLLRIQVQKRITDPIVKAGTSYLDGLFTQPSGGMASQGLMNELTALGIFHEGGIVGTAGPARAGSLSMFAGAPRFHTGGIIGYDEVPIIAKRGEEVLTEADPRHRRNGGKSGGFQLTYAPTYNIEAGTDKAQLEQIAMRVASNSHAELMDRLEREERI